MDGTWCEPRLGPWVTARPRASRWALAQHRGNRERAVRRVARGGQGWVAAGAVPRGAAWCAPGRLGAAPGGRSSRLAGWRRSLHHVVPRAPWRRRRVLPRRGKFKARVPQPRCSRGERAPRTRAGGGAAGGSPVQVLPAPSPGPSCPASAPLHSSAPCLPRGSHGLTGGWAATREAPWVIRKCDVR